MKHFQEIASSHAEKMGLGMKWMMMNGLIWVLVDMRMGIEKMPGWNEPITIFTMPSGYDEIKAYREFLVQGKEDDILIKASSAWMVLDVKIKRPKMMLDLDLNLPREGKRNFPVIERIRKFDGEEKVHEVMVASSSIDLNGHVNNTEYVRWAFDALTMEKQIDLSFKTLQFGYLDEVFKGDTLEIFRSYDGDDGSRLYLKARGKKKKAFVMSLGPMSR